MAIQLKTQSEVNGIIRSFKSVFKHNDISKLTKKAYNFIMCSSGFIAHYNIHGFQSVYNNVNHLKATIQINAPMNQWKNFKPTDQDYEYYMQRKEIYNKILDLIN